MYTVKLPLGRSKRKLDDADAKSVMMAEVQSASDGDGDSSCFAADDHRSWSCDSNCGADAKKDYEEEDDEEQGYKRGAASSRTDPAADMSVSGGGKGEAHRLMTSSEGAGGVDGGKERRRRRQKLANKDNLVCQVCGDKANGYNFGAVTCESCKAFFRRNALKNWDIKCNFDGSCKIDPFTRKFCTACRLQKCFSINMKKEWILDEEALKKRKKLSRRSSGTMPSVAAADSCVADEGASVDSTSTSSGGGGGSIVVASGSSSSAGGARRHTLLPVTSAATASPEAAVIACADSSAGVIHRRSIPSVAAGTAAAMATAFRVLPGGGMGGAAAATACSSSSPPYAASAGVEACCSASAASCGGGDSRAAGGACSDLTVPLSEDDSRMIASILTNHAQTADPFDRPFWDKVTVEQPARPQDVYNMADGFIRRLIKFVKVLPEFSSLSQDDQIALLKGSIMETLVIRSAYTYDPSIGGFKITSAETHEQKELKIAMMFRGLGEEVYAEHMKFITSFNTCAKWNKTIIVLAMVINLFSPDRQGLSAAVKPSVATAEERYSQLLLRYLHSLYSSAEAAAMYPRILMKLTDVRSYGEMTARQVARVSATDVEPLMKEIFNLK